MSEQPCYSSGVKVIDNASIRLMMTGGFDIKQPACNEYLADSIREISGISSLHLLILFWFFLFWFLLLRFGFFLSSPTILTASRFPVITSHCLILSF